MVRDQIKNTEYFVEFVKLKSQLIELNSSALLSSQVHESKVNWAIFRNLGNEIESLVAKYSMGKSIEVIKGDYSKIIYNLINSWIPLCTKIQNDKGELFDQYLIGPYERFLHLLSIGYLLKIPDADFQILVDIIDRDHISDNLYEFIIKARFPNRVQKRPEKYDTDKAVVLKVYEKLRKATEQKDKDEAARLVKQFLEKDFYHKHMNLYNSHNSKANIYCGYWSFEAAAVVKIMGLDDSSFIDNQYYPKDLVHETSKSSQKKGWLGRLGI